MSKQLTGVSLHARARTRERVGQELTRSQWKEILQGIRQRRWPCRWSKISGNKIVSVSIFLGRNSAILPLVFREVGGEPFIITVFEPEIKV